MRQLLCLLAAASVHLLPAAGFSLELVAPSAECSFKDGRVLVIGKGAKPPAGQGTLQWQGGSAPVSAWAGRFYLTAELPKGDARSKLIFGKDTLELRWTVGDGPGAYAYHPKVLTEECKVCHEPEAPPGAGTDISKMCYGCHTRYSGRKSVHGPVAGGLCTACHDPHGAVGPAFLRFPVQELCTQCHNRPIVPEHQKIKEEIPCMDCHDPHGANRVYNLKRR